MKSRLQTAPLLLLCLATVRAMHAQANQSPALTPQGYTGVINTPNGHVQQEGTLDILYSDQQETLQGRIPPFEDNYLFSFGVFKFAEIGGRLTNTTSADINAIAVRDMALNWKLSTAPLTDRYRFSPALAVGMEDAGDGHHFIKTTYVAGSVDPAGWLRLSAGYGNGPDRMKGVFGGMELRAFDWATLLAEYDTNKTNVGVRLTSPEIPYLRTRLTAMFSRPLLSTQNVVLSGGFSIPLDFKKHSHHDDAATKHDTLWGALTARKVNTTAPTPVVPSYPAYAVAPASNVPAAQVSSQNMDVPLISPETLRERLVQAGFVNVKVGLQRKTLVVEYENIRYNHSELDAIGVVCGLASQTDGKDAEDLRLVVRRRGLALLQIESRLAPLRNWMASSMPTPVPQFTISQELESETQTRFVPGSTNPNMFKPSLVVYPSLSTWVGTEHGLFDYQLSIRPELQVPIWHGATAVARADIPVAWSPNLNDGQIYAFYRTSAQLDRLMLFQAVKLAPGLVANFGGGKVLGSSNGTLNELNWNIKGGSNRLKVTELWGRGDGTNRNVILGAYRFMLPRFDLAFEGTGGRFWAQDKGFMVSAQRFYGDTALSLYFKDTVTPSDSKRWLQAGVRLDFPLTPRRDMKPRPVQFRGIPDWSYSQETGVVSSATQYTNFVQPNLATIPDTTESLALYYYDRDRLNADYILAHTERMKDAWLMYRNKL